MVCIKDLEVDSHEGLRMSSSVRWRLCLWQCQARCGTGLSTSLLGLLVGLLGSPKVYQSSPSWPSFFSIHCFAEEMRRHGYCGPLSLSNAFQFKW
jgi:hypothetical protein